jgi:hypothetical protein
MCGRPIAIAAALLMGTPSLAAPASGQTIWIELCDAGHPDARIPLRLHHEGGGAPAGACHAPCSVLAERRQQLRR